MPTPGYKLSFPDYYAEYGHRFKSNQSDAKKFLFKEFCKIANGESKLKDHKEKAFKLARESCASVGEEFKYSDENENFLSDLAKGSGHRAKAAALHFYLLNEFPGHGEKVSAAIGCEKTAEPAYEKLTDGDTTTDLADESATMEPREAYYIYEAAFLWHGVTPPNKYLHQFYMSQEIEDTKEMLHAAHQVGLLEAAPDRQGPQQTGLVVSRDELRRFAESFDMRPAFIFPNNQQSNAELVQGRNLLFHAINQKFAELLIPVSDWSTHDSENAWPVYQAAFLWHEFEPPNVDIHVQVMTSEIVATKHMLHSAIEAGKLDVINEYVFEDGVTRYVDRSDLKDFAKKLKQRPRFLFPNENKVRPSK